ncbi:MAG: ATP synthase F1 subunit delta [Rhodothermales bacterium]|jgi:F-type H+-transporting ATPase subunit delta
MSELAICRRYAGALLQEAESGNIVDRIDGDVAATRAALEESPELRLLFSSPVISIGKKDSIIRKLFEDSASDLFVRFLLLLNEKNREHIVADVLSQYRTLRNRQLGIVEAQARSAMAMSDADVKGLRDKLAEQTGADVHLGVEEDAGLLGGVVVRVGDMVYDGSLKRKLAVLKAQLEGGSFLRN